MENNAQTHYPVKPMGKLIKKCSVCERETSGTYCYRHQLAYENLMNNFKLWNEREEINFNEYIDIILNSKQSGTWVKELARHMKISSNSI